MVVSNSLSNSATRVRRVSWDGAVSSTSRSSSTLEEAAGGSGGWVVAQGQLAAVSAGRQTGSSTRRVALAWSGSRVLWGVVRG